ncbi:Fic family protein [Staphylococcus agnetis]|uniref:Fic family protein n=1 Tax=Staphylococcus agnetis TaxID=985762 RepID=UPI000D1AF3EA|nr:Fic family protein [Staphylococcus agnetis]PTH63888.1 Fic family protein [Staphylococcus agnetis]PTH63942.1 Fic family protein [Staphylococcus agnetis]
MEYKPLRTIFHMKGEKGLEKEYNKRLNGDVTFLTNININPIKDQSQQLQTTYPTFFLPTSNLCNKSEKIYMNTIKINSLLKSQPGIATAAYLKKLLLNELQSTNDKENIRSTKKELADVLNKSNSKTHKRFNGLVDQYKLLLSGEQISLSEVSDFRKIYDVLVADEISKKDKPDGKLFRNDGVGVEDTSRGKWLHRNEYNEYEIIDYLNKLLRFVNYYEAPKLLKVVSSHYFFEYLHPFYDANGRIGRYILAKYLSEILDLVTALTFSYTVNRNKNKYDKAFEFTSDFLNYGEITFFIDTILELIIEGQESAISQFEEDITMIKRLKKGLDKLHLKEEDNQALFILLQDKVFGSEYSRMSLKDLENYVKYGRKKLDKIIKNHSDKLNRIKDRPVVYEINDDFINELML